MPDVLLQIEINEIERRLLSVERCHGDGVWLDTRTLRTLYEMAMNRELEARCELLESELKKAQQESEDHHDEWRRAERELEYMRHEARTRKSEAAC